MNFTQFRFDLSIAVIILSIFSLISSFTTIWIISKMSRKTGYMTLILSLTFCEIIFDLNFLLIPCYNKSHVCQWTSIILADVGGISASLWTNVISCVVASIVINLKSFDIQYYYKYFVALILIFSIINGILESSLYGSEAGNIVYSSIRIASILFNITIYLIVSIKMYLLSLEKDYNISEDPVYTLVSRLKYYSLWQIIIRSGATYYNFTYGFDRAYAIPSSNSEAISLGFDGILSSISGIGYFFIFLSMQPSASLFLKRTILLRYFSIFRFFCSTTDGIFSCFFSSPTSTSSSSLNNNNKNSQTKIHSTHSPSNSPSPSPPTTDLKFPSALSSHHSSSIVANPLNPQPSLHQQQSNQEGGDELQLSDSQQHRSQPQQESQQTTLQYEEFSSMNSSQRSSSPSLSHSHSPSLSLSQFNSPFRPTSTHSLSGEDGWGMFDYRSTSTHSHSADRPSGSVSGDESISISMGSRSDSMAWRVGSELFGVESLVLQHQQQRTRSQAASTSSTTSWYSTRRSSFFLSGGGGGGIGIGGGGTGGAPGAIRMSSIARSPTDGGFLSSHMDQHHHQHQGLGLGAGGGSGSGGVGGW